MALRLLEQGGMNGGCSNRHETEMLRWIFRRGTHLLVCELAHFLDRPCYALSLIPEWDKPHSATEQFDTGVAAFQRHAAIVTSLRECGWTVIAYTASSPLTPDCGSAVDCRAA